MNLLYSHLEIPWKWQTKSDWISIIKHLYDTLFDKIFQTVKSYDII